MYASIYEHIRKLSSVNAHVIHAFMEVVFFCIRKLLDMEAYVHENL